MMNWPAGGDIQPREQKRGIHWPSSRPPKPRLGWNVEFHLHDLSASLVGQIASQLQEIWTPLCCWISLWYPHHFCVYASFSIALKISRYCQLLPSSCFQECEIEPASLAVTPKPTARRTSKHTLYSGKPPGITQGCQWNHMGSCWDLFCCSRAANKMCVRTYVKQRLLEYYSMSPRNPKRMRLLCKWLSCKPCQMGR